MPTPQPKVTGATSKINGLLDYVTFQDLSNAVGTLLPGITDPHTADIRGYVRFNDIRDEVTIGQLAAYVKYQEALPSANSIRGATPVATDPTNGSIDSMKVDDVVRFIMLDNNLPEE